MKKKYSVIVFDLGNVLLPFDYKIILSKLNGIERGLGEKFAAFYRDRYDVHRRFESGELPVDEFVKILLNAIDNKIGKDEFIEIYSKIFSVNDELVAVLPVLRENYRLVLLSNTNEIHQRYGWQNYGFLRNFDRLFLSHEVGAVKPDEKIYRAVETYTRVPSDEHLYVDDIPEYVEGGRKMGWDAVQFVGDRELFKEFEKRGIKFRE